MRITEPYKRPDVSPKMWEEAATLGKKLIHIGLAVNPTKEDLDLLGATAIGGQSFWAMVDFVPQKGDIIRTSDGKLCEVRVVLHNVEKSKQIDGQPLFLIIPSVFAVLDENREAKKG
jgi:hypothetical protein